MTERTLGDGGDEMTPARVRVVRDRAATRGLDHGEFVAAPECTIAGPADARREAGDDEYRDRDPSPNAATRHDDARPETCATASVAK